MAYFHITVLDNQIKALPTVSTASGSVATFDTDMTENLLECVCDIQGTQSGSGVPSSSNPRQLNGFDTVTLTQTDENSSTILTISESLGVTAYKGYVDWIGKQAVITHKVINLSSLPWFYASNYNCWRGGVISDAICRSNNEPFDGLAEEYSIVKIQGYIPTHDPYTIAMNINEDIFADSGSTTIAPSGLLEYELATPLIVPLLNIGNIPTINGVQNFEANCGDTSVKYLLTVGKKIS